MKWLITYVTRRKRGRISQRFDERIAASLHLGRSTDSDVLLRDVRVKLKQAEIEPRPGGLFMKSLDDAGLEMHGHRIEESLVPLGTCVGLGPYDVEIVVPPPGFDAAITVELARPMADDLEELEARSGTALDTSGRVKRRVSLTLVAVILVGGLALPVAAFCVRGPTAAPAPGSSAMLDPSALWESGPMSAAHRFFGEDCRACHQAAFRAVRDTACEVCHKGDRRHAEAARFPHLSVARRRCAECHPEHVGARPVIADVDTFCASCHGTQDDEMEGTALQPAASFATLHPEMRPTVVFDAGEGFRRRASLAETPPPRERSNLAFPHDVHMDPKGPKGPTGPETLACASCHTPQAGGQRMQPVDMERHCLRCHTPTLEAGGKETALPHASPTEIVKAVTAFYDGAALEGNFDVPGAPEVVRRRPGTPLPAEARHDALAWARERAHEATDPGFGKAVCGNCHTILATPAPGVGPGWRVAPVRIAERWLAKARFDHRRHATVACADCHAASGSSSSEDVLLPRIATCRRCHGGESATGKVPSTCIACHGFHPVAGGDSVSPGASSKALRP